MNYYYLKAGETFGPISLGDLQELVRCGQLPDDVQVCTEGAESWRSLSDLIQTENALEHVEQLPQPPPVPTSLQPEVAVHKPVAAPPAIKNWEYSVVPFVAVIGRTQGAAVASTQLETLIQYYARRGWEYVRLESVETFVQGDNGCFGIGATPPHTTVYSMAVFRR